MRVRLLPIIVSLLTWPGVPLHELAHAWACRRTGVRVREVCYLRLGNPRGYVIHDRPDTALQHIVISTAPFLVCSLLSFLVGLAIQLALQLQLIPPQYEGWPVAAAVWLGWAIGANSFPSGGDGDSLWRSARSGGMGIVGRAMIVPVVGLIRLGQLGAYLWLDLLWGVVTVLLGPAFVLWFLSVQYP